MEADGAAEPSLEELAARPAGGDRTALDALLRAIQDDIYRLAVRMLGHPADAEDATREILVKVVTNLGTFRGESSFRTRVWRIAANHEASVRRSRRELPGLLRDPGGDARRGPGRGHPRDRRPGPRGGGEARLHGRDALLP